jgi:hypothetical protein
MGVLDDLGPLLDLAANVIRELRRGAANWVDALILESTLDVVHPEDRIQFTVGSLPQLGTAAALGISCSIPDESREVAEKDL